MGILVKIPKHGWRQVGGDMNPGTYGGIIAEADGIGINIREIQPVREHVGDGEAREVGFPFWSKEGYYDASDLDTDDKDLQFAMQYVGLTDETLLEMEPTQRAMALAEAALQAGHRTDEGPAGWSKDVVPGRVKWWGSKGPRGASYLADEDDEFRSEVLGEETLANPHMANVWSKYGG
jgi:hypothetical protein